MPEVVLASDAPPVAVSWTLEAEAPATRLACSTRRPLRASFSIGAQRAIGRRPRPSCPGPRSRPRARGSPLPRPSRPSAVTDRTSTSRSHRSGTTLGRVPPLMTPDVDGHARPPAVERVQVARRAAPPRGSRCAPSRARPRHARPGRGRCSRVSRMPLRARHDVAVGAGTLEDQARVDVRGRAPGCARSSSASRPPRPDWRRTRAARTAGRRARERPP